MELKTVDGMVEELRARKDKGEIALIEEAVRLADEELSGGSPAYQARCMREEVALQLEYSMRRMGAEGAAFKTIVASGYRAALPHGVASSRIMAPGDLVILDFGAVYSGYHSDMTGQWSWASPIKSRRKYTSLFSLPR